MTRGIQHKAFQAYQEMIAAHPNYAEMPDLRNEDGSVQWEAPSNRGGSGKHARTYERRLQWWRYKAESIGIIPGSPKWISKTAKAIHPTRSKPCKVCGRYMEIRYVYPNHHALRRLSKYPSLSEIASDRFATIFDIVSIAYRDIEDVENCLNEILRCKEFSSIPFFDDEESFISWLNEFYIPNEPTILSPGVMSNAPDRLDGFHSFNLCCRGTSDKGRTSANLASYTTDRRAFENWSEGNWVAANQLMGLIRKNEQIQQLGCANATVSETHMGPITADHIGPISLGFSHRPVFRLLCKSCNSSKNNRMSKEDIVDLLQVTSDDDTVSSWYSSSLWNRISSSVSDEHDVSTLNKLMRDNRTIAFDLLGELLEQKSYFSMATLLSPEYASMKWEISGFELVGHIITGKFSASRSNAKYRLEQQTRLLRVSFESISEYAMKQNRNSVGKTNSINLPDSSSVLAAAQNLDRSFANHSSVLERLLAKDLVEKTPLSDLMVGIVEAKGSEAYTIFMSELENYMKEVSVALATISSSARYVRDLSLSLGPLAASIKLDGVSFDAD